MASKLELTWVGKDELLRIEPRLLIENAAFSNIAADPDTENMLIHGDNLLALKALESKYAGQIKCKLNDPDVIAKKKRCIQYCEVATRWGKANGYKEWRYLFIPSKQVMPNSSFMQLAKQFCTL